MKYKVVYTKSRRGRYMWKLKCLSNGKTMCHGQEHKKKYSCERSFKACQKALAAL